VRRRKTHSSTPDGRPSYVPSVWADTKFNRWMGRSPIRVLLALAAPTVVFVAVGIAFLINGSTTPGVIGLVAAIVGVVRLFRGGPAALHAVRRRLRG
jgi:hypothetical protein